MQQNIQSQLSIEIPIERSNGDKYAESMAEYLTKDLRKETKVFLCYCVKNKQYYVSTYFSREYLLECGVRIIK